MKKRLPIYLLLLFCTCLVFAHPLHSMNCRANDQNDTAVSGGVTRLVEAIKKGDVAEAGKILQQGCNVNSIIRDDPGFLYCPLNYAIDRCDSMMVALLLRNGADPNITIEYQDGPVLFAVYKCPVPILALLHRYGGNLETIQARQPQSTPLTTAIDANRTEIVKYLVENGVNVNTDSVNEFISPLEHAITFRRFEIVKYLLDHGTDINGKFSEEAGDCVACPDGITAMHAVISLAQDTNTDDLMRMVKLLLRYKPALNIESNFGQTPLGFACYTRNIELVDKLISHGARVDAGKDPALHCAARFSHVEMTRHLLKKGANPNRKNSKGNTPLLTCARCCGDGFQEMIDPEEKLQTLALLLKAGSDPTIQNLQGESFMDYLQYFSTPEINSIMTKKGYLGKKSNK